MALDVFVMPLWKFKAGDFTAPIEQTLGVKPTVVSLSQPRAEPWHWFLRLAAWLGIFEFHEQKVLAIGDAICAKFVLE
jgi:hypothetical protein